MSCQINIETISINMAAKENGRSSRLTKHIASCPECAEKVHLLDETCRLLDGLGMAVPSEGMWEKISGRLETRSPKPRRLSAGRRIGWAFAAALLVLVMMLQIEQPISTDSDLERFMAMHLNMPAANASQVIDNTQIEQFSRRSGIQVRRPSGLAPVWRLVKLTQTSCCRGLPVAHLMYTDGTRFLSVFEKPNAGGPGCGLGRGSGQCPKGCSMEDRCLSCETGRLSGKCFAVSRNKHNKFFVTGDLDEKQLKLIAEQLAESK